MKSVGSDNCDIITDTKTDLIKNECKNIGKVWQKNCPKCNKIQSYDKKWIYEMSKRENKQCVECAHQPKFPIPIGGWSKSCPLCSNKVTYTDREHYRYSLRNNCLCRSCCNKQQPRRGGKGLPKDYVFTDEHRKKLRLNRIKYLQSCFGHQLSPTYSKVACDYFATLNKINGWNGQYATSGGEYYVDGLGYWVDYYEPTRNIVIEYDEPSHYRRGNLLPKDIHRMEEIKKKMSCKFLRYNQKTNELKEW